MSSTALWYTTRATGVVALVLLTATMVLGMLTAGRVRTRTLPAFAQADLHKRVSLLAMVFLTIHVLTAVLDTYVDVGWQSVVVPFASAYRPLWTGLGTVGVDLLVAVAVSSAVRQRISARTWRGIHWLAYGSWPVAMAHSLGEGTDASSPWMVALAALCALAVVGTLIWRIREYRLERTRAGHTGSTTRVGPARTPGRTTGSGPLNASTPERGRRPVSTTASPDPDRPRPLERQRP